MRGGDIGVIDQQRVTYLAGCFDAFADTDVHYDPRHEQTADQVPVESAQVINTSANVENTTPKCEEDETALKPDEQDKLGENEQRWAASIAY